MFRNILVPTDGSPPSRRALELAIRFAREQNARVTALWVGPSWEPNLYAYDRDVPPGFISPAQHAAHVRNLGHRYLAPAKAAATKARVRCRCLCVEGAFPYLEILKAADSSRSDLIIMGSHGRRGLSRIILGSVTNMVLAHTRLPVMVCR